MSSLHIPVEFDVADMPEPKAFLEAVGIQDDKHRCEERHTPQPHPLTIRKIIGPEAEAVGQDRGKVTQ